LPIDPQFAVSTRQFGLDSTINAGVGIAIVTLSLAKLGIHPGPLQVILYLATLAVGVAIHYSIMFALASVSFWIVRAQGLVYGYYNLFNIARYPEAVFRHAGVFKFVFSWLIPVILVANVPARLLMGMFNTGAPFALAQLATAAIFVLAASRLLFNRALARYSSASS